jgi:hypothetical protein
MIHPPYIFRPLLGAGAIMAILLLGTWYWLPKLFPGFDPSEIGTVSADPSRATPPVLPNPGVGAPAQPASVAIRTSVPIATKPAAATSPEPAQQPVPAPTTAVADRAPAEVLTARSERDSKPAPPTLPTPDKANMSAHNSAYAGRGQDGLRLAHFKVQGSEDSSTIDGWVRAGLAVLEIRTDGASYVGEAGPQTGWRITPITRLSSDPRSQLRIVYPLGRAPIQRELLELLLVQNNILGARIVAVDVVFTQTAMMSIEKAQALVVEAVAAAGLALRPPQLHMSICFKSTTEVKTDEVHNETGKLLLAPRACR